MGVAQSLDRLRVVANSDRIVAEFDLRKGHADTHADSYLPNSITSGRIVQQVWPSLKECVQRTTSSGQLELTRVDQNRSRGNTLDGAGMIGQEPAKRTLKISDVKARLSSLVNEVYRKETRVLIEKAGIPVAALVSIEDLERLTRLDREWTAGTKALQEFSAACQDVPVAELEEQVARIIAEGRARDEAELERQPA